MLEKRQQLTAPHSICKALIVTFMFEVKDEINKTKGFMVELQSQSAKSDRDKSKAKQRLSKVKASKRHYKG